MSESKAKIAEGMCWGCRGKKVQFEVLTEEPGGHKKHPDTTGTVILKGKCPDCGGKVTRISKIAAN